MGGRSVQARARSPVPGHRSRRDRARWWAGRVRRGISAKDEKSVAMNPTLFTVFPLTPSHAVMACAVCFGQSDSPMAQATNMGIFLMLGVVAVVLASFASFF